ncbi:MAG: NAD(P)-dependent oxidoreductase [Thermoleophilaceae bacterium]|nr:NAD(P)-dependent oxidoreductase [Thermoleophilaceae bacterium]
MAADDLSPDARVLVTGGSGFIGTNLVESQLRAGRTVLNVDRAAPRNAELEPYWQRGDLLDRLDLARIVGEFGPTHVLHMAARTDLGSHEVSNYATNVQGVTNLIAALSEAPALERAVFASSRLVCRIGYVPYSDTDYCPSTAYGASKMEGERVVRSAADIPAVWTIVRPTSIWGPWFDVPYRDFFIAIARGRYLQPRGVSVRKSFGFVDNTVHQLERLLEAPADRVSRRTLYLADDPPLVLDDWAERIRRALGAPAIRSAPLPLLRVTAAAGTGMQRLGWTEPPLTRFRLANLLTDMVHDLEPLNELVGPPPISLEDGVRKTAAWLRAAGHGV